MGIFDIIWLWEQIVMVKGRFEWWHDTEISDKKYIERK